MKIAVLDGYTTNPGDLSWARFERLGSVDVYEYTAPDEVLSRCAGHEIIISNKTVLGRDMLAAMREAGVRSIGLISTGYNVVDVAAAAGLGITVTFVPSYGTEAVAQHTFALLLELTNRVGLHNDAVKAGDWSDFRRFCFWRAPMTELCGKIFGIYGYGRIGRTTAGIARALGMQVRFCARRKISDTSDEQVSADRLFAESDVLSLHCPLNAETTGLICRDTLSRMKPTAYLINTSRGGVVQEKDLAEALKTGVIAGAALDVMCSEPPAPDNPLLKLDNCILTPHIAWAAKETRERLLAAAAENLECFLSGAPRNIAR